MVLICDLIKLNVVTSLAALKIKIIILKLLLQINLCLNNGSLAALIIKFINLQLLSKIYLWLNNASLATQKITVYRYYTHGSIWLLLLL